MLPLQLSWFLEFAPDWLGPLIMLFGLPFLLFPLVRGGLNEGGLPIESNNRPSLLVRNLGYFIISVAFVLVAAPTLLRYMNTIGVMLLLTGKWIEGIAASKLFWKVIYYILYRETSGGIQITRRVVYYFLLIFVFTVSFGSFVIISSSSAAQDPFNLIRSSSVLILWTLFVLVTSLLGLSYKLWGLSPPRYVDRTIANNYEILLFGAVLSISGAEIFNFQLLTQQSPIIANEIFISSLGLIVYSIGYWVSVVALLTNQ